MTKVIAVPVPATSALLRSLQKIDFCDAYQVPLRDPQLNVQQAYLAVFDHPPQWVNWLMRIRGLFATALGLQHVGRNGALPDAAFRVGQRVGLFTIQSIQPHELIVGEDDKHLNFRVSVLKSSVNGVEVLTVSTAVDIHNWLGRAYMLVITPFHRLIARSSLRRAATARRL